MTRKNALILRSGKPASHSVSNRPAGPLISAHRAGDEAAAEHCARTIHRIDHAGLPRRDALALLDIRLTA